MTAKKELYKKQTKICLTCQFIDEYICNVEDEGYVPFGYDGIAACCVFSKNLPENEENMEFISPYWNACKKYVMCTKRQADYLDIYDPKTKMIIKNPHDISKIDK